jgi:glycosyltransferase involved in cell wall biosynthesis
VIVLDIQALQSPAYARRGVGRHVAELVRVLVDEHPGAVDVLAWNDRLARGPAIADLDHELGLGDRVQTFSSLRATDVDVLHVPAPFSPLVRADDEANDYVDMAVPVRARRLVVTLHDLIPWRFPDRYLVDRADRARYHSRLAMLLTADAVLAVSESAAADAIELVGVDPRRISVVGAGAGARFTPADNSAADRLERLRGAMPGLQPGFVAVPAAMDWRKNLDGAFAAYAQLAGDTRARHQLVVVADLHRADVVDVRLEAQRLGIDGDVHVPGFVDDDLLVDLYRTADVVMVPSRYEGFGLPVVEARRCGTRVICSDASSLPEVLPDARARFDPDDIGSMAEALRRSLDDPDFQAVLDAVPPAPYDWSLTGQRVVAAYERGRRPSPRSRRPRPRLAVVTITPPVESGVADHSARLIEAFASDAVEADVEVFTPGAPRRLDRAPGVEVRHLAALPERHASREIDGVVYCLGNDPVHRPVFDVMRAVPGAVLLHDIRITRLFGREGPPAGSWCPESDIDYTSGPVASIASPVLVQSEHARELLHAASGFDAVDVGPHPCWNDGTDAAIDDPGPPWVISAGIAHELKQTDLFVAAMRLVTGETAARVAIVGDGGPRFLSPADDIVATGQVDDGEFDRWLRRASLAVQLRAVTNGESSGVVAHALARGVPLVVTDIGAMRELPDDVAVRVPVDATPAELAAAIAGLLSDPVRRGLMRAAALRFATRNTPVDQARRIVEAICHPAGMRG